MARKHSKKHHGKKHGKKHSLKLVGGHKTLGSHKRGGHKK